MATRIFKNCVSYATEKFNSFYNDNIEKLNNYIKALKESKEYKDFETRLSWDLARVTRWSNWDCFEKNEFGYPIVEKDSHLTTLFKQALRNSNIKY